MNKAQLVQLITRNDEVAVHAIGRALVHLFNRQTRDEQAANDTRVHNLRGFTSADARQGCIHAKYYLKHRSLQPWQVRHWLKADRKSNLRLGKYWRQLSEEAAKKAARQA